MLLCMSFIYDGRRRGWVGQEWEVGKEWEVVEGGEEVEWEAEGAVAAIMASIY